MKIGILGSGNMGRSLGMLWAEQGHRVCFGGRTAEQGKAVAQFAGHDTLGGTHDEAAAFGEVLLYTIRGVDPAQVLSSTDGLAGKVVIDCNNQEIPPGFAYPPIEQAIAETLAAQIPQAHVVKAFNTIAQEVFELSPTPLEKHCVSCFVCGDDAKARATVHAASCRDWVYSNRLWESAPGSSSGELGGFHSFDNCGARYGALRDSFRQRFTRSPGTAFRGTASLKSKMNAG